MSAVDAQTRAATILIVEDEASAREASRRYLEVCGFRVRTAATAAEAETQAADFTPDIAICDWRLAGSRDGVEIARELQRRYSTTIIFMTAYPLDELKDATRDLEVAAYFRKPVSLTALAEAIETADTG